MTMNLLNKKDNQSDLHSGFDSNSEQVNPVGMFPATHNAEPLRPQFWTRFALTELNHSEWEALCDGCGSCCLIKYIDEDERGDVDEALV